MSCCHVMSCCNVKSCCQNQSVLRVSPGTQNQLVLLVHQKKEFPSQQPQSHHVGTRVCETGIMRVLFDTWSDDTTVDETVGDETRVYETGDDETSVYETRVYETVDYETWV